ncbi:MAG: FG-GAP-like repeat-containing protein [Candidatus Latescibacterota bacterium]|nr:FG-GAP-like repeat-containing protein [Candidatus Latescibacterota bacterium]
MSVALGLGFVHSHGGVGDYHLVETMGSGGAFIDYDCDGWLDLYLVDGHSLSHLQTAGAPNPVNLLRRGYDGFFVTRGERLAPRFDGMVSEAASTVTPDALSASGNKLYRNQMGDRFQFIPDAAGAADPGYGMGCAVGDANGDGASDLYVTNYHRNQLYLNVQSSFRPNPAAADSHWSTSATFLDYDLDGDLDLYVANYLDYSPANNRVCGGVSDLGATTSGLREMRIQDDQRTYCSPRYYNGAPDVLYRNGGDGRFDDVSAAVGVFDVFGKGLGVVAGDFDDDGDPDLYVANDGVRNSLWRNDRIHGGRRFKNVAVLAGAAYGATGTPQAGMGVDVGDLDGDLDLDLVVTNFSREHNNLYRNDDGLHFTDVPVEAGLGEASLLPLGFGALLADLDHDADLDLFVANGHVMDRVTAMDGELAHAQPDQLFINEAGRFRQAPFVGQLPPLVSRGAAMGDYDRDGDLDLLVTANAGPARLFRNDRAPGNWLVVQLRGKVGNPFGIGARIEVHCAGSTQVREIRRNRSYLSSSSADAHFGLGTCTWVEGVKVRWPGGEISERAGVEANRYLLVRRG